MPKRKRSSTSSRRTTRRRITAPKRRTVKAKARRKAARIVKRGVGGKYKKKSSLKKRVRADLKALAKYKGMDPTFHPNSRIYVTSRKVQGTLDLTSICGATPQHAFPSLGAHANEGRGKSIEIMFDPLNFGELLPASYRDQRLIDDTDSGEEKRYRNTEASTLLFSRRDQDGAVHDLIEPTFKGYHAMATRFMKAHMLESTVNITFYPHQVITLTNCGKIGFQLYYIRNMQDLPSQWPSNEKNNNTVQQHPNHHRPNNINAFLKQKGSIIGTQYLDFNNTTQDDKKPKTLSFVWHHKSLFDKWQDDEIVENPTVGDKNSDDPANATTSLATATNSKLAGDHGHHFGLLTDVVLDEQADCNIKKYLNAFEENNARGWTHGAGRPGYILQVWKLDGHSIPIALEFQATQQAKIVCHHPRIGRFMNQRTLDNDATMEVEQTVNEVVEETMHEAPS
jgi:hypothetical protein